MAWYHGTVAYSSCWQAAVTSKELVGTSSNSVQTNFCKNKNNLQNHNKFSNYSKIAGSQLTHCVSCALLCSIASVGSRLIKMKRMMKVVFWDAAWKILSCQENEKMEDGSRKTETEKWIENWGYSMVWGPLPKIMSGNTKNYYEQIPFNTGANACVTNWRETFKGNEFIDGIGKSLTIKG